MPLLFDGERNLCHMVGLLDTVLSDSDKPQFADGLPKTRSGKIMRRILRKIAKNRIDELGDTSTLADPSVVTQQVEERL